MWGYELKVRGKSYAAPKADELWPGVTQPFLKFDGPRPVLYFRSFQADEKTLKRIEVTGEHSTTRLLDRSQEELMGAAFKEFGPTIAVGGPRDEFPFLGVARASLQNEEWQAHVTNWMKQAALVVIRAGLTEGLLWELNTARSVMSPERIVLLISSQKREYEEFRARVNKIFPYGLPDYRRNLFVRVDINGLVYFDEHWHGTFVPLSYSYTQTELDNCIYTALSPVMKRLGLSYQPPPRYAMRFRQVFLAVVTLFWFTGVFVFLMAGISECWFRSGCDFRDLLFSIAPAVWTIFLAILCVFLGRDSLWQEWDSWRPFSRGLFPPRKQSE
jgi:hypothetical protein